MAAFHGWLETFSDFFPTALLEEVFAPVIEAREPGHWVVKNSAAEMWVSDDKPRTNGFMVTRPPGDPAHPFWKAVLEIMQKTPTVFYWVEAELKPQMVVANPAVIPTLPPDMVKALGTPAIVTKPEDIQEHIEASFEAFFSSSP